MSQNTKISYLYRDASNYKVWNDCVIPGEVTPSQQKRILDSLDMGEFFIPSAVGLPEKQFDSFDAELDHPWFELAEDSFELTLEEPTVSITPDALVQSFTQYKDRWADALTQKLPLLEQIYFAETRANHTRQGAREAQQIPNIAR